MDDPVISIIAKDATHAVKRAMRAYDRIESEHNRQMHAQLEDVRLHGHKDPLRRFRSSSPKATTYTPDPTQKRRPRGG
jgi:hypothetical protein